MIIHELKILYNAYKANIEARKLNQPAPYPHCRHPGLRISILEVEINGKKYHTEFITQTNEILPYPPYSNESSEEFITHMFNTLLHEVTKLIEYEIETAMKEKLLGN